MPAVGIRERGLIDKIFAGSVSNQSPLNNLICLIEFYMRLPPRDRKVDPDKEEGK
jgi:hypothetical protein